MSDQEKAALVMRGARLLGVERLVTVENGQPVLTVLGSSVLGFLTGIHETEEATHVA